jgi:hypothetical protein
MMTPAENHSDWLDRLLTKMGGDKQGKKEFRLSMTYAITILAWAALSSLSDVTLEKDLIAEAWIWPMVLLPIVTAPLVLMVYLRFYRGVDELAQKLQSNALAIGFAIGVFAIVTSMSLNNVGYEGLGVNESFAILAVGYAIGTAIMAWRYYK